jgi:hypothetical protein
LFLLLRHHSRIISAAAREILAREELFTALNSLQLVLNVVEERVHTLRGIKSLSSPIICLISLLVIFRELFMWSDASAGDLSDTAFGMVRTSVLFGFRPLSCQWLGSLRN